MHLAGVDIWKETWNLGLYAGLILVIMQNPSHKIKTEKKQNGIGNQKQSIWHPFNFAPREGYPGKTIRKQQNCSQWNKTCLFCFVPGAHETQQNPKHFCWKMFSCLFSFVWCNIIRFLIREHTYPLHPFLIQHHRRVVRNPLLPWPWW